MTISDYKEEFDIFNGHAPDVGPEPVHPSHEKLQIFVGPGELSKKHVERLEELGFHAAPVGEPEPHFYVFT